MTEELKQKAINRIKETTPVLKDRSDIEIMAMCHIRVEDYIAGATENGIQWHKVADGDIPPDRHNVLSEKGEIVVMKDMRWYEYSPNYDNILQRSWEEPKYWCEIPKLEVEQ